MTKTISILGATGTIGLNSIDLVKQHRDEFEVKTLIARDNFEKLAEIADEIAPENIVIANEGRYSKLKNLIKNPNIKILAGDDAVNEASRDAVDIYISGAVGFCALEPTMNAIKAGSNIGLANKECMVCAGEFMRDEIAKTGKKIIPIDSEHNSIFQVFNYDQIDNIEKIILTASGGPFREFTQEQLTRVTPEMAVKHPNWDMGAKISVDSATMMNKGLEVIEAYQLFPIEKDQIDVLIHPQSVIHGMVAYDDGSFLAGLSTPDMKIPISYAMGIDARLKNNASRVDLAEIASLTFEKVDEEKYKCFKLARQALDDGTLSIIALNAANEIAVAEFLNNNISFLQIAFIVETVMENITKNANNNSVKAIKDIIYYDEIARNMAYQLISSQQTTAKM